MKSTISADIVFERIQDTDCSYRVRLNIQQNRSPLELKDTTIELRKIRNSKNIRKYGNELYSMLIPDSIKKILSHYDNGNLTFITDEEFGDVPWEILYTGSEFFGLKFAIGRIIRTNDIDPRFIRRELHEKNSETVVVITGGETDLPCTEREITELKAIVGENHFDSTPNARKKQFSSIFNRSNYKIVHYAGHSYKSDKRNGFFLSDGDFTPGDIADLKFTENRPFLFFSNSCFSATAEDDNSLNSIAGAFLKIGVYNFIGCCDKIEDSYALGMAKSFYQNYLKQDFTVAESLRRARKEMAEKGDSWHVYRLFGDASAPVILHENANVSAEAITSSTIKEMLNEFKEEVKSEKEKSSTRRQIPVTVVLTLIIILGFLYFYFGGYVSKTKDTALSNSLVEKSISKPDSMPQTIDSVALQTEKITQSKSPIKKTTVKEKSHRVVTVSQIDEQDPNKIEQTDSSSVNTILMQLTRVEEIQKLAESGDVRLAEKKLDAFGREFPDSQLIERARFAIQTENARIIGAAAESSVKIIEKLSNLDERGDYDGVINYYNQIDISSFENNESLKDVVESIKTIQIQAMIELGENVDSELIKFEINYPDREVYDSFLSGFLSIYSDKIEVLLGTLEKADITNKRIKHQQLIELCDVLTYSKSLLNSDVIKPELEYYFYTKAWAQEEIDESSKETFRRYKRLYPNGMVRKQFESLFGRNK